MRPWDKHPPWAHWAFYVVWIIAGSFGPIALIAALTGGSAFDVWIGIGLCIVWVVSLAVDWLVVRWLQNHAEGWTPWQPPAWRWLLR